jgi:hypothetical protein
MGNTLQIVDSIASSPTVLLDLNNESPFGVADFDAPPPQLRRTTSSSMLADGERISQSSYENRQIRITFDQISASQDAWATSWQTLARLIDQDTFWLKYQPTGATSPVFFRCYRTDVPSIEDVNGAVAYRIPTISIPADHAAYGLPVDIASFTITNDASSGTNRMLSARPSSARFRATSRRRCCSRRRVGQPPSAPRPIRATSTPTRFAGSPTRCSPAT